MGRWYVAQTKPNHEVRASQFLSAQPWGATCYVPKVLNRVAHAGRVEYKPRPFLPGYIFVAEGACGARRIATAPGVSSLVAGTEGTALIGDEVLNRIRSREDKDGYVQIGVLWPPARGDAVHVSEAHSRFGGLDGVFGMTKGNQRSQVFLSLLGKLVPFTIDDRFLVRT